MTQRSLVLQSDRPILEPYPYQVEASDALHHHICAKETNPCVVIPTGGGKSLLIAWIIQRWKDQHPPFRVCILAHRKELVEQNSSELADVWPDADIGVYSAGLRRRDMDNSILFASIDSVFKRGGEFAPFDVVIVDEAHRIPPSGEGKYRSFLKMQRIQNANLRVIGFTATAYRMTGPLCHKDHILQEVCYEAHIHALIKDGYLCKLWSRRSEIQPNLADVRRNSGGDYVLQSLAKAVDKADVVSKAIANAVGHIKTHGRKNIIFFCVDVAHVKKVSAELMRYGIRAPYVTASTPVRERDRIAREFKSGQIKAICNVNVYTEGFNAKQVDCICLLRPTLSKGLYCLDMKTEVLTPGGWSQDICVGDPVATFDISTGSICYEPATGFIKRPVMKNEKFCSIKGPSIDVRVTDKHQMIARTSKHREWNMRTAKELSSLRAGAYIPVSGLKEGLPGLPLTDAEIRFIGWVMTDGNINKQNKAITISQGEHQPWLPLIEKCIKECGFKYNRIVRKRSSQFKSSSNAVLFTISRGKPRGRDKHLRGWSALEPYLSKDFSPQLQSLTERQFDVLLEAIHLGDGSKQAGQYWTRRSYHIASGNEVFAERLQIAGITHGYRSSVSVHAYNVSPLYVIHLKKTDSINVGSKYDSRPTWEMSNGFGEECWCVETPSGTIITRRNGKVAIVGNCQMVGRGLRIHPDKDDCLILDYAHCIDEHGPVDCIDAGMTPLYECGECGNMFSRQIRICPHCGWEIPKKIVEKAEAEERERRLHEIAASNGSILSGAPEDLEVHSVAVRRHKKEGKPDSLRVEYRCGLSVTREWICLDHDGPAGHKACDWWIKRFGPPAPTVDEALQNLFLNGMIADVTKSITVVQRGKYKEITAYNILPGGKNE